MRLKFRKDYSESGFTSYNLYVDKIKLKIFADEEGSNLDI